MKDLGQVGRSELALDVASPWQHRSSVKLHHAKSFCFPLVLNPVFPGFGQQKPSLLAGVALSFPPSPCQAKVMQPRGISVVTAVLVWGWLCSCL